MITAADPETVECETCGNTVDYDESTTHECGKYQCDECWRETLTDCTLCGEEVEEEQVSPYIVAKQEFAKTGDLLPGIYRVRRRPFLTSPLIGSGWIHEGAVLFIDRLPQPDATYEMSGHICDTCARPYAEADRRFYGRIERREPRKKYPDDWYAEERALNNHQRQRVRMVVAEHPEMLRDLEEDVAGEDLQRKWQLPVFAPTYHELLFLAYKDVRIYWTCPGWATWLTLHPEPSARNCTYGGWFERYQIFAPTGLKTYVPPVRRSATDHNGDPYDRGYRYGNEHDAIEAAREACRRAIDAGMITSTHAPADAR